jgi:hypothetical protein
MIAVCVGAPTEAGQVRAAVAALRQRGFRTRVTAVPTTCPAEERSPQRVLVHRAELRHGGVKVVAMAIWDTYAWTFLVTDPDQPGLVEVAGTHRWFAVAAWHAQNLRRAVTSAWEEEKPSTTASRSSPRPAWSSRSWSPPTT